MENIKKAKLIDLHAHVRLNSTDGAAGKYGFHEKKTIIRFKINQDKIENLEIIELK